MSNLKKLVDQAVDVEIELRRLESLDGQLTAKAYLAACASVEGASVKEADVIEAALSGHEGPLLWPSVRRMTKAIIDFKRSGPITKLGGYLDSEGDSALGCLSCTRQSAFLVAGRHVAARRPDLFGTSTKIGESGALITKCLAERARLRSEIERGWDASDVVLERDRASFRLSGGVIAVCEGFAENLVNWSVAERAMAKAA